MSDEEKAFLKAVCWNPADDAPRLIYADWLEEHGQAERAEFIRLQIELERLKFVPPTSDNYIADVMSYRKLAATHEVLHGERNKQINARIDDLVKTAHQFGGLLGKPPTGFYAATERPANLPNCWRPLSVVASHKLSERSLFAIPQIEGRKIEFSIRRGFIWQLALPYEMMEQIRAQEMFGTHPIEEMQVSTESRQLIRQEIAEHGVTTLNEQGYPEFNLNAACLNWGRAKAELPPLPELASV